MTTLLIARHGNTFDKGDTLLRVGARTDLPLSVSGREQAKALGQFLAIHHPLLDAAYCSRLQRTRETAALALQQMELELPVNADARFDEIDYGPDEGKPETDVVSRVGQKALDAWEKYATPPPDWNIDPAVVIDDWQQFTARLVQENHGKTTLVVTSNGIARFVPYILSEPEQFMATHPIKLATGAISCLEYRDGAWQVAYWNRQP